LKGLVEQSRYYYYKAGLAFATWPKVSHWHSENSAGLERRVEVQAGVDSVEMGLKIFSN
jgi:hypothetical protein